MNVLTDYHRAWTRRGFVLPVFVMVRLLGVAIILPLVGLVGATAVALSGQQALTDQDIAYFIFTPTGFLAGLCVVVVLLIGSVLGLATMTVGLQQSDAGRTAAILTALRKIARRLPALGIYAVLLVGRVLMLTVPFVLVGLGIAHVLIGEFDINYYLSQKPPEFFWAVALIGAVVSVMVVLLVSRLLLWAVSLHLVLFGGCAPWGAFAQSAERMKGVRLALLRDLGVWFACRALALVVIGLFFGWMMGVATADLATGFRWKLTVAIICAALWGIAGVCVAGIALGALARILNAYYGEPDLSHVPQVGVLAPRWIVIGLVTSIVFGILVGGVLINTVKVDNDVQVIAHRGAAGARPENTMASVRKAVEDGADWVEIDVQETRDGEIVVMHDSDFMKQASVPLKIWDATMEDLADIDIGSWYGPQYAQERTPLLRDVLEAVQGKSKLLIELKYYGHDVDLENRTIALVQEAGMEAEVATMSLKYPAVQKMKSLMPSWPAGVLAATAVGDLAKLDGDFVAVNAGMVGPKLVRAVHNAGKELYVWTVNDPLEMSGMISLGVDGLITDEPALAKQVIEVRSTLTTPERVFILFMERFDLTAPDGGYAQDRP